MAALELTAAKRQARMALRMEDRLPPPVRDSVALVGVVDAQGLSGPRELAVSHLLGQALARTGLGLADQALVAALKRELSGDSPALTRETFRRLARLTGAYYALMIRTSGTGPMTAELLPVLPEFKRVELLDRTRTRIAERLNREQEHEATLQKRMLAVKRGLDYFKAKERIPALLVEKDVLCKKVSQLLKTGRVDEARESLAEIQALDREMDAANKQIKNFKRELFELELNVFNVTPAYLQEEGPRLKQRMAESRRSQESLQEALSALDIRRTHMIGDSGAALELAALCSPVPVWQDMAAERVLLRVRPETRPDPRLSAAPLTCSGELPQIERERLDALGLGIQARNNGDYRSARDHFARCAELDPPGLPPEGLSPVELADAPPSHAALLAYNMLVSAVRGQGGS
jgi:tetratricopeptide (TPR) repeat protein